MPSSAPNNFFDHFIKYNGFKYDYVSSPTDNFENLIRHLKCYDDKGRSKLLKRFKEENISKFIEPILNQIKEHEDDLIIIRGSKSIEEFFNHFKNKYNIRFNHISVNYLSAFNTISFKREWNILHKKTREFNNLSKEEKKIYLEQNFIHHNLDRQPNLSLNDMFKKLKEHLKWKNYERLFKYDFFKLIAGNAEKNFENLQDLKNIILRYRLMNESEIPDNLGKCRKIVEERLFVNIYDFCNPSNHTNFKNNYLLAMYTIRNKLYYPLAEAKNTFCYKVLLRYILRYK